jgi:hypothetical protein
MQIQHRRSFLLFSLVAAFLAAAGFAFSGRWTIGVQHDGRILTPTGRLLTPAGTHIEVNDRPLGMVLSPARDLLAVVTGSNFNPRALHLIDVNTRTLKQTIGIANSFVGVAFSPSGEKIYVGGGASNDVKIFSRAPAGAFASAGAIRIAGAAPSGLSLSADGSRLYVALNMTRSRGDRYRSVDDRSTHTRRHLSLHDVDVGGRLEGVRDQLGGQSPGPRRFHRRHVSSRGRSSDRHSGQRDPIRDRYGDQHRRKDD